MNLDDATLAFIFGLSMWLLGVLITLVILWLIIRGAVLSALRKHADEQAELGRRTTL